MIEVELPDGSIAEFPDGTPNDVMKQAIAKRLGRAAPQQPADTFVGAPKQTMSDVGIGEDMLRSGATGLRQGVESLVGGGGDVRDMAAAGSRYLIGDKATSSIGDILTKYMPGGGVIASLPTTQQIHDTTKGVIGENYQPQTIPGEYARTMGQFAPAAVAGPGGIVRKAAMTAAPAILSETAGQLTKGTGAEPYARAAGAVFGGVAASGRNANVVKQAIPTADALRTAKNAAYKAADMTRVGVKPGAVKHALNNVRIKLADFAHDPDLQPDTAIVVKRMVEASRKKGLTLAEVENLRKKAVNVAKDATKPSDRTAAGIIIEQLDNMMDNSSNFTATGKDAVKNIRQGRALAKQTRKMEIIDEVMEKAQNQATGFENGLVIQFRQIANNAKRLKFFSPQEQAMIKKIVRRPSLHGLLRAVGMLSPNSTFGGMASVGLGVGSGVIPGLVSAGAGALAKSQAGRMTRAKVGQLKEAVATGRMPVAPPVSIDALIRTLLAARSGQVSAQSNSVGQ